MRNVGAPQKLRVPPRVAQLVFGKREKKLRRKVVGDCGEHSVGGSLIRLLVREHAFGERLRAVDLQNFVELFTLDGFLGILTNRYSAFDYVHIAPSYVHPHAVVRTQKYYFNSCILK